ncbi:MAG: aquaporin [Aquiluna sp.]|nr:aquaporin [Aquiluna sp.]MCF8545815.1 aquaporin [Aquiluna sp.]
MNSSSFQRFLAESLGVAAIVAVVIGASHMAANLAAPAFGDLIMNALATAGVLVVAITILGPISGAHFNPIVTLVFWIQKKISAGLAIGYLFFQLLGGALGAILANLMFDQSAILASSNIRSGIGIFLGEIIASFGLVFLILMAIRISKEALIPSLVALWIVAGYFFTSSTSFANPAVTFGRAFSDAGSSIAWESVGMFVVMQIIGALLALFVFMFLTKPIRK